MTGTGLLITAVESSGKHALDNVRVNADDQLNERWNESINQAQDVDSPSTSTKQPNEAVPVSND